MTDLVAPRSYDDIFRERGSAYDRAMRAHPGSRDEEFAQVIAAARLSSGMVVADVPAGGGYLKACLPRGCVWIGHEPCVSFTNHGEVSAKTDVPLLPLPFADESVDAAISLAGVHHIDDKRPLFAEIRRVVRPGGRFVLSDVAAGSDVARFLDGFVGAYNSTGHEGVYLDGRTVADLENAGWEVLSAAQVPYHWTFADRAAMADFCRGLFDICRASPGQVEEAIDRGLGVDDLGGGRVGMRWGLMTIVAVRN
jgi:SAM-dependent methyltransferase